jgi:hypothetical protein
MVKQYNKFAATTDGYRGKRAILNQRVIEGLEQPTFDNGVLLLNSESAKTQYLNNSNMAKGYFIVLPKAIDMWDNWQVAIINESSSELPIYYYTDDLTDLHLFKTLNAGNMCTCILVDSTTEAGVWTTLRTLDTISADTTEKYTSNIFDEFEIEYNNLQSGDSVEIPLSVINAGTAVRSIYVKTVEQFVGATSLKVSIGTDENNSLFFGDIDLTAAVSDTNFDKDLFEEILSNTNNVNVKAFFNGKGLVNLTAGKVKIVIERAKLIDPTVLKNAIVNTTVPTGAIMSYVFNDEPAGWFRLDGRTLTNANQVAPQFVAKLNEANNKQVGEKLIIGKDEWEQIERTYGSCGKFCWIGANLRFPKIAGFIKGLIDITQLGKAELDTMRPITGGVCKLNSHINQGDRRWTTGAFYMANNGSAGRGNGVKGGSADSYTPVIMNSGLLGTNYNGSETQPKCVKYPYIISVFNKIQWTSQLDYDNLIKASVNKADIDLSNVTSINLLKELKEEIASWITPDWESAIEFNGQFTAPSNGWVLAYSGPYDWQNVNFTMNNVTYLNTGRKSYNTATCMTFFIQKGRTFRAAQSGGICRFIPCKLR